MSEKPRKEKSIYTFRKKFLQDFSEYLSTPHDTSSEPTSTNAAVEPTIEVESEDELNHETRSDHNSEMGDRRDERTLADYNRSNNAPQIRLIIDTVRFHGLPNESPHHHLAKFMHVSMNQKINGVPQDEIRLRLFPYTLSGKAEAWLDSLPSGSITTWKQMTDRFLGKYFTPERTARCRDDILSFKQHGSESLYESWERFKELLSRCPRHSIPIIQLMDKFYNGLDGGSRRTLDLASNGAFNVMRANDAWDFLE